VERPRGDVPSFGPSTASGPGVIDSTTGGGPPAIVSVPNSHVATSRLHFDGGANVTSRVERSRRSVQPPSWAA
jgi:hypothetical protein